MAVYANIQRESVEKAENILIENGIGKDRCRKVLTEIGLALIKADVYWYETLSKTTEL